MQRIDHNVGFQEKTPFFRRKWGKIAENCDHNKDPSLTTIATIFTLFRPRAGVRGR
jgi:hypothetical protein